MSAPTPATLLDIDAGVAWITLNRPASANARNQQMRDELLQHYRRVVLDDDVRVIVITGSGSRFFCAGMDMKESALAESFTDRRERLRSARDIDVLASLSKPTIAAVNGAAFGGGFEMALACDIRIVADDARLALPELSHGLIPGGGGTYRLARLIGTGRAFELLYTAKAISGTEAVGWGLANVCAPGDQLVERVQQLAAEIAKHDALALRYVKELVRDSFDFPAAAAGQLELDSLLTLIERKNAAI